MLEIKRLYIAGMETHSELVSYMTATNNISNKALTAIEGTEDFKEVLSALGDGMSSLGGGVLSTAGWVGGKAVTALGAALGGAGNLLSRAFSDNDVLIKKILQHFAKSEEHEIKFSAAKVTALTSTGDIDTFEKDLDKLLANLTLVDQHSKDLVDYLDKQMNILRGLKSVKTTEDVFGLLDKYEEVKYPVLSLANKDGGDHYSEKLPNGKVIGYQEKTNKYLMSGDSPEGSASELTMSKSEVSNILTKLNKVNGMHKRFKSNYESYMSFVRSWSEMVKTVESNLSQLDKVSKSAIGEAEKLLGGNPNVLAFYSGFTPRVVSYTDRYIHGVLGVFA